LVREWSNVEFLATIGKDRQRWIVVVQRS